MTINLAILRNVAKIANKKAGETGTADSTKLVSVFTISDVVHTENLKKSGHKAGRRLKSRDVNSLLAMHKRTTAEPHHARAHDSYNLSSNPPLDLPGYKTVNELEATVLMATREGDSKKYYSEKIIIFIRKNNSCSTDICIIIIIFVLLYSSFSL